MSWGKSGWISNAATSMPQFLCPTAPDGTMTLRAHPTNPSDLTPKQAFEFDTGILHTLSSSDLTLPVCYWAMTQSILPTFTWDRLDPDTM